MRSALTPLLTVLGVFQPRIAGKGAHDLGVILAQKRLATRERQRGQAGERNGHPLDFLQGRHGAAFVVQSTVGDQKAVPAGKIAQVGDEQHRMDGRAVFFYRPPRKAGIIQQLEHSGIACARGRGPKSGLGLAPGSGLGLAPGRGPDHPGGRSANFDVSVFHAPRRVYSPRTIPTAAATISSTR